MSYLPGYLTNLRRADQSLRVLSANLPITVHKHGKHYVTMFSTTNLKFYIGKSLVGFVSISSFTV